MYTYMYHASANIIKRDNIDKGSEHQEGTTIKDDWIQCGQTGIQFTHDTWLRKI